MYIVTYKKISKWKSNRVSENKPKISRTFLHYDISPDLKLFGSEKLFDRPQIAFADDSLFQTTVFRFFSEFEPGQILADLK